MATLKIGGFSFTVSPETAAWSYAMKIQSIDTYGGRVIQLLACNIENLSIEGYIQPYKGSKSYVRVSVPDSSGGKTAATVLEGVPYSNFEYRWGAMQEFEYAVKKIMAYHEAAKEPAVFSFPEVGWYGKVYLTGYTDVRYEADIPAVKYTLKFDIDSGFDGIQAAVSDYGLKNIPDGVGWVRSVYNTPAVKDWEAVKDAIGKIVDDAGTHDASNPADFYKYLVEAREGGEDEDSEKTDDGSKDDSYAKTVTASVNSFVGQAAAMASVAQKVSSPLKNLGII